MLLNLVGFNEKRNMLMTLTSDTFSTAQYYSITCDDMAAAQITRLM